MMKVIHIVIISSMILLVSCNNNNRIAVEKLNKQIDSLNSTISSLNSEIEDLEIENPFVRKLQTEASTCLIIQFVPKGLDIKLHSVRPSFNDSTYFCVPAAFTSPETTIEGVFIENGKVVNKVKNNGINGFVMFSKNECIIDKLENLSDSIMATSISKNHNLFQQILLVNNSNIVKCELFKDRKNTRRAIIKYGNGAIFIAETHRPVTILEFQKALVEIGVKDALYLDMGSWSEGWYRSSSCERLRIGELFSNTSKQTNWLTFERKK
ncbi:phosphodiester glycosidase family protein [Polaribacter litorisediminis]|uniref:phosphodiester glycosidase family protein n=1 Tax=Polaribacter litorisediminis TaxID=1908341 RepID=UPI001CBC2E94|nr:phosphodiester glycosidase family protein [Polaribacter litorisediminis]UAM99118.1 phosphodiester glycosidase family protein [Polaribacter litorisediminis]